MSLLRLIVRRALLSVPARYLAGLGMVLHDYQFEHDIRAAWPDELVRESFPHFFRKGDA